MRTHASLMVVLIVVLLAASLGGAGVVFSDPLIPGAVVAGKFNYQGRLTSPSGLPLDGVFPMRFQVYDDAAVGVLRWDSGVVNVTVVRGLFNVGLGVNPTDFNGTALWLRLYVNGEWLSPRQELAPVPYALSLRPGAQIRGEPTAWSGWVLNVTMDGAYPQAGAVTGVAATGSAVRGESSGGLGVYGYTQDGYAVYGRDTGTSQARGYGGYFASDNGVGVYGYSAADRYYNNTQAPGVYGRSLNGVGVYGVGETTHEGVRGESVDGQGLHGVSTNDAGVYGYSTNDIGVYGRTGGSTGADAGVYGLAGAGAYGVHGYQSGTSSGLGSFGETQGTGAGASGLSSSSGNGTWGYSANGNGLASMTARADNNYGLYTYDNLYSLNIHSFGAAMQVVQNGDQGSLEQGDVVAIAGLGDSPVDGVPLLRVAKASEANSTAVIGVVYSTYAAAWLADPAAVDPTGATGRAEPIPPTGPGPVAPGDYLLIVVRGPCLVKANAAATPIQVGDLLASSSLAGHAARAARVTVDGVQLAIPGTVFAKALAPLAAGQKLVAAYVTLQ
ncbi:MAG: hypothetical protein WAW26_15330 [Anaerolineae bacterium]|nr:hypothetical protein [Anaerolineae bacterium]